LVAAAPAPAIFQPWFTTDAEPYPTTRSFAEGQYKLFGGVGVGEGDGVGEGGGTEPPQLWTVLGLAFVPTARQPTQKALSSVLPPHCPEAQQAEQQPLVSVPHWDPEPG